MMQNGRLTRTSFSVGPVAVLAILLGGCSPATEAPVTSSAAENAELDSTSTADTRTVKRPTYIETFDDGPGGWYGGRKFELPVWDGVAYCYGPWWTDANHAPPGAGYLHMLLWAYTVKKHYQVDSAYNRALPYRHSRFAEEGYSTNLTNAKLTVRLRGHGDFKEAELLLLVQAQTDKTTVNSALTGQPFKITREWSEQTVTLAPDPAQWTCLGARHDMRDEYGCDDIDKVLADVNFDIIFILFPLKVVPAGVDIDDINIPRAVKNYPVDQQYLPKGLVMFDTVKIEYPD